MDAAECEHDFSISPEHSERYAELKRLVIGERLVEKQLSYYMCRMVVNFCLLAVGIATLVYAKSFDWQLLNAAFLAFVFTQMGFMVHDAGHHQIFADGWKNDWLGIFHADLLLGFSYMRWVTTHNMHHSFPNQLGVDPDTDFPVLAFTKSQAGQKRGIWQWTAKYQSYLFYPMLFLEAVSLKADCLRFLIRGKSRYRKTEIACLLVHFPLYFGLIFHYLHPAQAILFILVHQALFGFYLSMVIAPNHIGMPILEENVHLDFLSRQVLTSRNLRAHVVTDYMFGALCCQIEHHLFPTMPQNRLRKAQKVVRPFCESHGLSYSETGALQSYRDIASFLHQVSAQLRVES